MEQHLNTAYAHLTMLAATYGLSVLGALLILIVGRIVAGMLRSATQKTLTRVRIDATVAGFAANLVFWAVVTFAIISALSNFGVQTTSFVAALGACGLAIGLAVQGSLSNFAAGVMILIFRPFQVGDRIEAAGVTGTVTAIEMFMTIIRTDDNVKVIVPNAKLNSDVIKNHSAYTREA